MPSGQPKETTNLDIYGHDSLPWSRARDQLVAGASKPGTSFFLATTRPDGRPHVAALGILWHEGDLYFQTGPGTRKARNLAANPRCVICSDNSAEAVIVEGKAEIVEDAILLKKVFAAYQKKYKMDVSGMGEPMFRVRPQVVFGLFEKKFGQTATRWLFS